MKLKKQVFAELLNLEHEDTTKRCFDMCCFYFVREHRRKGCASNSFVLEVSDLLGNQPFSQTKNEALEVP